MALKLQYRSTFIDVEESPLEGMKARARSLPATTRPCAMLAPEVQDEDSQLCGYVITLAQRAEQLRVLLRRPGTAVCLKDEPVPDSKQQLELETCSTVAPSPASEVSGNSGGVQHEELVMAQRGSRKANMSGMGSPVAEVFPSLGSVGHPEVCRRPCLYFAAGSCNNGDSCGYCHMPHTQRPVHLDKKQRELLKKLPAADLLPILARQMQTRAAEGGFLAEAAEVLSLVDTWASQAQENAAATALPSRDVAKLDYSLKKMTFSSLLSLAVRNPETGPESSHQEVVEALCRMRARLAAAAMSDLPLGQL